MKRWRLAASLGRPIEACQPAGWRRFTAKLFPAAMRFFTLQNKNGLKLKASDFGGAVSEIHAPDRDGRFADVALGFDSPKDYAERNAAYFGAIVGRFGNRISGARFELDGQVFDGLAKNDGPNHLHGGAKGFDKVLWDAEELRGDGFQALRLTYRSADGEEGYPGNLDAAVTYTLTDANEWIIEYEASCDKPTICNLTNHAYFNLAGHAAGPHLGHELRLNASSFVPTGPGSIPTGEIRPVRGGALDFTTAKPIGRDIEADDEQLKIGNGYDHCFVIDKAPESLALAAVVYEPTSGREMKVYTTEPGVQLYTGNFLDGRIVGKGRVAYRRRVGFCLETQRYPDSPNKPQFPTTTLRPGEVYRSKTVYEFGTRTS